MNSLFILYYSLLKVFVGITMERSPHLRQRDSEGTVGKQLAAKRADEMHFVLRESTNEHAMLMAHIEKDGRGMDRQGTEITKRAPIQATAVPFFLAEFSSENVQLSLSIGKDLHFRGV